MRKSSRKNGEYHATKTTANSLKTGSCENQTTVFLTHATFLYLQPVAV